MSDELCACGHPKDEHGRITHQCYNDDGESGCDCDKFRPGIPWPAERGCYWWKHGSDCEIVYATDFGDEQLSILRVGFEYRLSPESAVRFGPASFTKLLERNPYEPTPG